MEVEPMMQILLQLGVATVLGWYLYYTTTISFPKMLEQMLARMDAIQDRQSASTERICRDFTATMKEERDSCHQRICILQDEVRFLRGISESKRNDDAPKI